MHQKETFSHLIYSLISCRGNGRLDRLGVNSGASRAHVFGTRGWEAGLQGALLREGLPGNTLRGATGRTETFQETCPQEALERHSERDTAAQTLLSEKR